MKIHPNKSSNVYQNVYIFLLVTGIILLVFSYLIFRRTFIHLWIPVAILLFTGLIAFLIIRKHYNRIYGIRGFFYALSNSVIAYGGIVCFLFLGVNYFFTDADIQSQILPVKRKYSPVDGQGKLKRLEKPAVMINYEGINKELVFEFSQLREVTAADYVVVDLKRGLLGFDILCSFGLVEKVPEQR